MCTLFPAIRRDPEISMTSTTEKILFQSHVAIWSHVVVGVVFKVVLEIGPAFVFFLFLAAETEKETIGCLRLRYVTRSTGQVLWRQSACGPVPSLLSIPQPANANLGSQQSGSGSDVVGI